MERILDFSDAQVFQDALNDQDPLMVDITIHRCTQIVQTSEYAGDGTQVLRRKIYTRAEVKPVTLGEVEKAGGVLEVGDLEIRVPVEVRGIQNEVVTISDVEKVADIITLGIPYQGDWYVVGVPEPGELVNGQYSLFYNVNIRRVKGGRTD